MKFFQVIGKYSCRNLNNQMCLNCINKVSKTISVDIAKVQFLSEEKTQKYLSSSGYHCAIISANRHIRLEKSTTKKIVIIVLFIQGFSFSQTISSKNQ
jgi:hypothetical protein